MPCYMTGRTDILEAMLILREGARFPGSCIIVTSTACLDAKLRFGRTRLRVRRSYNISSI